MMHESEMVRESEKIQRQPRDQQQQEASAILKLVG